MNFPILSYEYSLNGTINYLDVQLSVLIVFNSAESRALLFSKLLKKSSVEYALLINFQERESNKFKDDNLKKNQEILSQIAKKMHTLTLPSIFDYYANLSNIVQYIPKHLFYNECIFFIDVTGAPLIYSTALVKYIKSSFPTPNLYLLNVSAHYENGGLQEFSDGRREDIFIPGFYGAVDHEKPFHYVFLLGYEGERSMNILKSNEPECVSVIIPDPGYEDGNADITLEKNRDFLQESGYKKADSDIFRIPVYDVENVKNTILKLYVSIKDHALLRLVPLGPKPHALGAALAGMEEPNISIIYQVPKTYHLSNVSPSDKMWLYIV